MNDLSVLIPIFGIFFAVGVPVMALAAHFVLRPLVRDIAGALRAQKGLPEEALDQRLARLEENNEELQRLVRQLVDAERFRRELESGAGGRAR